LPSPPPLSPYPTLFRSPPPLIGTPVCQNTGTFLANSFTPFHKKQFSFVIPLFLSRIPTHAYDYCLRIPRVAYVALYSRACILAQDRKSTRLNSSHVKLS